MHNMSVMWLPTHEIRIHRILGLLLLLKTLQRLMKEVFMILKTAGATYQRIDDVTAFRDSLYNFAEQEHVRNGIWNACLNSARS